MSVTAWAGAVATSTIAVTTNAAPLKADFTIIPFQTDAAQSGRQISLIGPRDGGFNPLARFGFAPQAGLRIAMAGCVLLDCDEPFHRNADSISGECCLCPAAPFSGS